MNSIKILEDYISAQTETNFFGSQKDLYKNSTPSDDKIRANQDYKILVIKKYRHLVEEKWKGDKKSFDGVEGAGYKRTNDTAFQPGAQLQILAKLTDDDITSKSDSDLNEYIDNLALDSKKDFNAINKKPFNQAVSSVSNLKTKSSSIISLANGLSGALLAPIGFGLVVAESGIRTGLTCLSCLGYGVLKIAEKLESTSLARKVFGNNEFGILGAQEHTLSAITSLVENNYTLGAIDSYFFSNGSQKSAQNIGSKKNSNGPSSDPAFDPPKKIDYNVPKHDQFRKPKKIIGGGDPLNQYIKMKKGCWSSIFKITRSEDVNQLDKAEKRRFEEYKKEEERQEAEKIRKEEEAKQKAKNTRPPKRASSLPSPSASQIHNSLFGPDGRLKRASTIQSSPLSRPNPKQPRRNEEVANRRPSSDPRQPLSAKPASSKGVGAPPPRRY